MKKSFNLLCFLLGAFSLTQIRIVGNIGISELFVCLASPFLLVANYTKLKRCGFMTVIWLSILTCISCLISSRINGTPMRDVMRGFATPYAILAWIVVLHHILEKDFQSYRWLFVGLAVTYFLNIYAFQTGRDDMGVINGVSGDADEAVIGNALFWVTRVGAIVKLPIVAWYMQTPLAYSIMTPLFLAGYALFSTASGRSSALGVIGAGFLIAWGGKSARRMSEIRRHILVLIAVLAIIGISAKNIYQYSASKGYLGEQAREKYEKQTRGGKDALSLLMGGRGEFFIGLIAALDRPIVGFGPWALDTNGYSAAFLEKYGVQEDYEQYLRSMLSAAAEGRSMRLRWLPTHSHLIGYWVWYGIVGLIFWIYVLYIFCRFFVKDTHTIPQLFGYFVLSIPITCWNIFFSPVAHRCETAVLIVMVLFADAVRQKKFFLPSSINFEIIKYDK